ncbi:MAG: heme ABC exporter ATP-binding protein CcmA [Sulfitobacter sp.]
MMLKVENLTLERGGVPVLADVSFDLAGGQALILRGPNGAGKTTLLRALAGIQPILAGKVTGATDSIAYAGHADGLKAMLTVRENLTFWAQVFGGSDISGAMDAFALHPLADRLAMTLSAGQKRRLGLARLLVTGCSVWVLDEPTVSLDKDAVALFANAVVTHLAQGGCALIATHIDLGLDAQVLDITPHRATLSMRAGASDEAFL